MNIGHSITQKQQKLTYRITPFIENRTLVHRSRNPPAGTSRAISQPHRRRYHTIIRQTQRHRFRQCLIPVHRKPGQIIMLQVQRLRTTTPHILNILLRHFSDQPVVIQIQTLHSGQCRRQLSGEKVMTKVDDRSWAVGWGKVGGDHTG